MNQHSPYLWKVEPLCSKQLLDVDKKDILNDGLFRKCNTYKSGGGYDKFPAICNKRLGRNYSNQFVVQLHGCNLNCWYCYVTKDGYQSTNYREIPSEILVNYFINSGQDIFHLMGGSPALYMEYWPELIRMLPSQAVFHSDFTLTEKPYDAHLIKDLIADNCLYAVNIKGTDETDFYHNTGKKLNKKMFYNNLDMLVQSGINFYLTFTNPNKQTLELFKEDLAYKYGEEILRDSFVIDLIQYNAITEGKNAIRK